MAVYSGQIGGRRESVEMIQTWLLSRIWRGIRWPSMQPEAGFPLDGLSFEITELLKS